MATIEMFQRIKNVREKEKNQAQEAYKHSIDQFESAALELYNKLKEKEEAQKNTQLQLQQSLGVDALRSSHLYMERLMRRINELQHVVQMAREDMDFHQKKLAEAHIEVKKFHNVIENKKSRQLEKIKMNEMKLMDELSVRQFMNNRNR